MDLALKELGRIVKPFPVETLLDALGDRAETPFDRDAVWHSHSHGGPRPEPSEPEPFGEVAYRAGLKAIAFLAGALPVGDPRRERLIDFERKIRARLANDALLLWCGVESIPSKLRDARPYVAPGYEAHPHHHGTQNDALVSAHGYLYFRPARLEHPEDLALCARVSDHFGYFETWRAHRSAGFRALLERIAHTPLAKGQHEADPRASHPDLVAEVARRMELSEDAATVFLQVLALPDCKDAWLRAYTGLKPKGLGQAIDMLVEQGLLELRKEARAGRKAVLPGRWEKLASPDPGTERWKLALYQAHVEDKLAVSPLDRILPLEPLHELFARAWRKVASGEGPSDMRAPSAADDDWLAAIAEAPGEDEPRLVYADHLTTRGDPRGELISLRSDARPWPAKPRVESTKSSSGFRNSSKPCSTSGPEVGRKGCIPGIEQAIFDRGFIAAIRVRAPHFVAKAELLLSELPMLAELILHDREGFNPIPAAHLRALAGCPQFARIRRLDFTADQYIASLEDLDLLLQGKHFPALEWLRIGFHRRGDGFGLVGARRIAQCERLVQLRFLEISGQGIGPAGARALLDSDHLERLQVLRLPLNEISDVGAQTLIERLQDGALPSLRVLDLGNVVETSFVTRAVQDQLNTATREQQHAIQWVLGERDGNGEVYVYDALRERRDDA